jgi:hypothetical protein
MRTAVPLLVINRATSKAGEGVDFWDVTLEDPRCA